MYVTIVTAPAELALTVRTAKSDHQNAQEVKGVVMGFGTCNLVMTAVDQLTWFDDVLYNTALSQMVLTADEEMNNG